RRAVDGQVGKHDGLRAGVVPVVGGRLLEVPHVLAGGGAQRDDRAEIQVVAAGGAAQQARPRRAVAGTDVEQVEVRVVRHAVPRRAAAAILPPRARPRLGRLAHGLVLERQAGVAGHGPEAPGFLARLDVVRGDEAAHAELRAADAGDDLVAHDTRRAGNAVVVVAARDLRAPPLPSGVGAERHEAAVPRADEHLALAIGHPAIARPATQARSEPTTHALLVGLEH